MNGLKKEVSLLGFRVFFVCYYYIFLIYQKYYMIAKRIKLKSVVKIKSKKCQKKI